MLMTSQFQNFILREIHRTDLCGNRLYKLWAFLWALFEQIVLFQKNFKLVID